MPEEKVQRLFTEADGEVGELHALLPAPDGIDPAFAAEVTLEVWGLLHRPDLVQVSGNPKDGALAEKVLELAPVFGVWRDLVGPNADAGDSAAAFAGLLLEPGDGELGEDGGGEGPGQDEKAGKDEEIGKDEGTGEDEEIGEDQDEDGEAGEDQDEDGEAGEEQDEEAGEDQDEDGEAGEDQDEDGEAGEDQDEDGEAGEDQDEGEEDEEAGEGEDGEEKDPGQEEGDPEYDALVIEISPAQEGKPEEDEEEGKEEGGEDDGVEGDRGQKKGGEGGEDEASGEESGDGDGDGEAGEEEREDEDDKEAEEAKISGSLRLVRDDQTELLSKILPSLRHGPDDPACDVDPNKLEELSELFRRQPEWRKLLDLVGRLSESAWSPPARVASKAREDVLDLELGNDTSRILTSELARLAVPELAALAWVDLAERRMRQVLYEGNEPRTSGPILVAIDVSPSMDDPSGLTAPTSDGFGFQMSRKKLAMVLLISLVRIADVQHRKVFFCGFADRICWERSIRTPSEAVDACLFLLRGPPSGMGTSFDPPLGLLCSNARKDPRGGADMLLITDGEASVSPGTRAVLDKVREVTGSRLFSLLVTSSSGSSLEEVSDEVVRLSSWEDLERLADQVSSR